MLATREGDRIRCGLCPRACLIGEGGTGACGARGVVGGSLRALTYGLVSSAADDPIEKKPVFHYRPGSRVLSVGGVGCSLRCGHCQNWRISRPHGVDGSVSLEYLPPDKLVSLALERACEGVAWTYNEPIIWLEYVLDGARIASQQGLFSVMVTNGYVTTAGLDLLAEHVDVWRTDLKAYSEDVFRRLCHADDSAAVRTAAVRAKRVHGLHVECVTNVVPTINDSDEELRRIADFIVRELSPSTPWHVTRFVPHLDFSELDPTPLETLERARTIGMEEGLEFVYLGNVDVPGGEDTRCPGCHVLCVSRRGFSADPVGLDAAGHCSGCGRNLGIVR
jgi:pyruvate formate lyase activating enzyme